MSNPNLNKRYLGLIAGILAIGLVAASIAGGQALSAAAQQNQDEPIPVDLGCETGAEFCEEATVSMSGTATSHVKPDRVTVTVGVETSGPTAEEAASQNADLVAAVIAALKELGIDESQMSTSQYSIYPQYSYKDLVNACRVMEGYPIPPECYVETEITSYKASSSISVTLDVDGDVGAGQAIDAAVGAGANTVSGAYFFVSSEKQEEVRGSLIKDAIDNARSRADKAAEAVGMQVTGVKSLSLNDVSFPVFYDLVAEGAPTPVLPGQQEVSMTVQVDFLMS